MTTRLDDLLGQLTVDVPEAPTIDELRSRVHSRHRRPSPLVAVLIGLVLVSIVFIHRASGESAPDKTRTLDPVLLHGPRSFEISVRAADHPDVQVQQFDSARWDWISENFPPMGIRVDLTSTSLETIRYTAPTWEQLTDEGVRYLGNQACDNYLLVCVGDPESVTLTTGADDSIWVLVQPRLTDFGHYAFTTQIDYEVLSTGERGSIPVDVELTIWEPEPGTEPPPDPVPPFTIIWSPPTTRP